MPIDSNHKRNSRREILRTVLRAAALSGAAEMLAPAAYGGAITGGRAAVCIYLLGGNDSNNMMVPLDRNEYSAYAAGRGGLALPSAALLRVNAPRHGGQFGFHSAMPEVKALYDKGVVAVLANTGSLLGPLTKAQAVANTNVPPDLYSHLSEFNARYLPPGILTPPWIANIQTPDGASTAPQVFNLGGVSMATPARLSLSGPTEENSEIRALVNGANLKTVFPRTFIGSQLMRVAKLLQVAGAIGVDRPVFSCSMGGWDTHSNELAEQAVLLRDLSQAMNAFFLATQELGVSDQVATYTKSEFNRALRPNGRGGTEHGWGGHELIMGGAVRGGDIYGRFPSLALGGPDDVGVNGIWIPTVGTDQLVATVAYWHGVGTGQLQTAAPRLSSFTTANLGFLG